MISRMILTAVNIKLNKLGLVTLFISLVFSVNAQQKSIDVKYGFNKFDLGATIKHIQGIATISKINSDTDNFEYYNVKNPSTYKLFNVSPKSIRLGFVSNMLTVIYIEIENAIPVSKRMVQVENMLLGFEKLYGGWEETEPESPDIIFSQRIVGERTVITFNCTKAKNGMGDIFTYYSIPLMELADK